MTKNLGGHRKGAGRPKGAVNQATKDKRALKQHSIAEAARKAWKDTEKKNRGVAPSKDDDVAADWFITRQQLSLFALAKRNHQYGVAARILEALEERCFGRVPMPVMHGGIDGAPPIGVNLDGKQSLYVCQLADGRPAFTREPATVPGRPPSQRDARGRGNRSGTDG